MKPGCVEKLQILYQTTVTLINLFLFESIYGWFIKVAELQPAFVSNHQ